MHWRPGGAPSTSTSPPGPGPTCPRRRIASSGRTAVSPPLAHPLRKPGTKADISRRIDDLEKAINALAAEERALNMDRMPGMDRGANQVQIVRQLAENMIVLYQQNLELKEQIAALKAKKS